MKISRKEGAFFLAIYICYTIMLIQSAIPSQKQGEASSKIEIEQTKSLPASSSINLKTN